MIYKYKYPIFSFIYISVRLRSEVKNSTCLKIQGNGELSIKRQYKAKCAGTPIITTLGRLRQKHCNLGYLVPGQPELQSENLSPNIQTNTNKKKISGKNVHTHNFT